MHPAGELVSVPQSNGTMRGAGTGVTLPCDQWIDASSGSRTSTGSPARSRGSAGSARTKSPATCSAGSCLGVASSNVFLENGARLYLDVGSHPEYATPECDSICDLVMHDKAGERILESAPGAGRAAPARGGHPRGHLPVQEQHRFRRQLLRLPRELPDQPARRLRALRRGAHPVLRLAARSTPARARSCRRPAARCTASANGPSTSGRACRRRRRGAARSSTPATSRTPTPSAFAAST